MKKVILSVAALFAFGFVSAQDVKFGIKGGVNFATLTGDVEDTSMKVGFNVGGLVEIKVSEKFSVQPELLFSTQGAKEEYSETSGADSYKVENNLNLGYLNIPIMAKYYVVDKFSLEAGPQFGFLMSAKSDYTETQTVGGVTSTFSEEVDVKDDMNSVDFGINFGAGYDFTENISAGVRYNLGLSDITDEQEDNFEMKNSVIALSIGYKF
ncbi:porin family protein [Flavobacterium sp.]|uniref:porin family protein n=1 Tax=Flavobacterium sp. TaxID=239 RepID=UPI002B4AC026|nr:porin family protein [Flavobacterium sp.]HLF53511.1 porin family protein [Flavobacterium sp.]